MTSSGNEWKTRYETQVELNGQLERQMSLVHERLEGLRGNPVGEFIGDGAPSVCLSATDACDIVSLKITKRIKSHYPSANFPKLFKQNMPKSY